MLRSLWTQVWITLVVATVLLAFYTSLGRQLIPLLETQKPELETLLQEQLGLPVQIGALEGDWNLLSPVVRLRDVRAGLDDAAVTVGHIEAELDISASAFYFSPVFKRILIDEVRGDVIQGDDGAWYLGDERLGGVSKPSTQDDGAPKSAESPAWLDWLGLQQAVVLNDWHLTNRHGDLTETLLIRKVLWRNRGEQHALEGDIAWGREEIADIFVSAELRGPLWPWQDQDGDVYLRVDEQEWTRWIPEELPRELNIPTLRGSLEGWLSITDGDLSSLYLDGSVPQLTLSAPENDLVLTDGHLLISGERSEDDWHLSVQPVFTEPVPLSEVRISSVQLTDKRAWQIGIPEADLGQISAFILDYNLLPERFAKYVANLDASGRATDLRVNWVPDLPGDVDIRADIHALTTKAYIGIPAFWDADGSIHLQSQGGVADIRDDSLQMKLEDIYEPQLALKDATAKFYWDIRPEFFNLRLHRLNTELEGSRVYGDLAIRIPKRDTDVEYHLGLMLGVEHADISLQTLLVPDMLDPAINEWLDTNLRAGQLSNVNFILNGQTGSDIPANSLTTQLYLEAENTQLSYLEEWPLVDQLSGRVFLDAPNLDVAVESATTLGGQVQSGSRVRLRDTAKGTELSLNGRIVGPTSEAIGYLQQTPVAELVDGALDTWTASGNASTDLRLSLLLGSDDAPDVALKTQLSDSVLSITDADLTFTQLNGPLAFDTTTGLSAQGLTGRLFGGDLTLDLRSKKQGDSYRIFGDARGQAQWASFRRWADLFLLDPITGSLAYQAGLEINPRLAQPVNLLIESDLAGTDVRLPAPLGKAAADTRAMTVQVAPGSQTQVSLNYDDLLRTAIEIDANGEPRGEVVFGDGEARLTEVTGIGIRGHVPAELDVEAWWDVWDRMMYLIDQPSAKGASSGPTVANALGNTNPVSRLGLTIDGLDAWGTPLGKTMVTGTQADDEWTLQVDNQVARGTVVIRADDDAPLVLMMDYVHVPEPQEPMLEATEAQAGAETAAASESESVPEAGIEEEYDPLQDVIPGNIAALDMTIQELYYGTRNFGRWQATSRPIPAGLSLNVLDSDVKGLRLRGTLDWVLREGQHATRLTDLDVTADNVAKVQQAFRLQPVVEGRDLKSQVALSWLGSPAGFNTRTLDGDVTLRISKGKVNAEGAAALKAFGALNFNSLFRRLRLDFSDLVGSGMAFDVMKGSAHIEQGMFTFTEPLTVDGPGGKFLTSGSSDLNLETLDMKLAVTFPVTGTLPLVAVIAGFAPPVAASIYVTERLIGDELERFTSASYSITGTWTEPQAKLNKAFDNSVEGKTNRGFLDRVLSIFGLGGD